jgi:hypothetical protein
MVFPPDIHSDEGFPSQEYGVINSEPGRFVGLGNISYMPGRKFPRHGVYVQGPHIDGTAFRLVNAVEAFKQGALSGAVVAENRGTDATAPGKTDTAKYRFAWVVVIVQVFDGEHFGSGSVSVLHLFVPLNKI